MSCTASCSPAIRATPDPVPRRGRRPSCRSTETPCPSCTSILDSLDGAARQLPRQINLAVIAKADSGAHRRLRGGARLAPSAAPVLARQQLQPPLPRRNARGRADAGDERVRARRRRDPPLLGHRADVGPPRGGHGGPSRGLDLAALERARHDPGRPGEHAEPPRARLRRTPRRLTRTPAVDGQRPCGQGRRPPSPIDIDASSAPCPGTVSPGTAAGETPAAHAEREQHRHRRRDGPSRQGASFWTAIRTATTTIQVRLITPSANRAAIRPRSSPGRPRRCGPAADAPSDPSPAAAAQVRQRAAAAAEARRLQRGQLVDGPEHEHAAGQPAAPALHAELSTEEVAAELEPRIGGHTGGGPREQVARDEQQPVDPAPGGPRTGPPWGPATGASSPPSSPPTRR